MAPATLDTIVSAETPEGILLELRPAGLTARCYAFLIDGLIKLGV
ncbi:MAG TPA: RDD family protein, partial [Candidatus Limnocylindria bacterium]|nr:RDD family protein [Candidatus Limnocylindria bacterium]